LQDAFSYPLPIKPFQVTEQVIESGKIRAENSKQISVKVDQFISPNTAKLEVTIANTLIPQVITAFEDMLKDDDLPFLETSASQLAIAANLKLLSQSQNLKLPKFNLEQIAIRALANIQTLQLANGGFARYPAQTNSDPYVSPYAARAIAQAIAAKFPVLATLLPKTKSYLQKILANPNFESEEKLINPNQVRLDTLLALAELGEKRNDFVADIYRDRAQLDITAQSNLARLLIQLPEWKTRVIALAQEVNQNISQTGRTAVVNYPMGWNWLNSNTVAQAQAVRLCVRQFGNSRLRSPLARTIGSPTSRQVGKYLR